MASPSPSPSSSIPPPAHNQTYVNVSVLEGGRITLPEARFIAPADADARVNVPSMSFLISRARSQSTDIGIADASMSTSGESRTRTGPFRMLFDLGLRQRLDGYDRPQREHLHSRAPFKLEPGVAAALNSHTGPNACTAADIDLVMLSHVHYDHHGDPLDFPNAAFVVGSGSLDVLAHGLGGIASHQHFQSDLFPAARAFELPASSSQDDDTTRAGVDAKSRAFASRTWHPISVFPHALDLFDDGSVYALDAPGHLPGHTSLLCRLGPQRLLLLAGDTAHDRRLLTGDAEVGTWQDDVGNTLCIHLDKAVAEKSIDRLRRFAGAAEDQGYHLDVVLAHDWSWWDGAVDKGWVYPGCVS